MIKLKAMIKKIFPLLLFALIVYLSGCKVGPDYQRPEYTGPDSFRYAQASTDTVVNLRWWELYNDPTLDSLIDLALQNNKDLLVAAARVEAARINVGYTSADQWPSFSFDIGAASGNFNGAKLSSRADNFFAYPQVNWEIGFWGKYRRLTESARADYLATEYGRRSVQLSLITNVAATYFQLLSYKSQLEISRATLASRDSGLTIIEERYEYGVVAELDLNQAQVQRAISAAAVPQYERAVAQTESSLKILLGDNPGNMATHERLFGIEFPSEIPVGLPSQLLDRRPDILEAEANVMSQNAYIGAAEAMRLPSLNLTGLFGLGSDELSSLTTGQMAWSASGSLLGPIFEFGKNKKRAEIARYEAEAALQQYENTVLMAFKDVEDALIAISTLKAELAAQRERNIAAINAEKLSDKRYLLGETSYLEVLESQRQSFDAQLNYSQTRMELLSSFIGLYNALGGGWITPEEEQAAENGN